MRAIDRPLYTTWRGVRQRCNDPNTKSYKNYGGRGIKLSEAWSSFWTFEKDIYESIGPKPSHKHTLDRIDNDKGYEQGNMRWATRLEQTINRRQFKNNKSGYTGVSWHKHTKRWTAQARIEGKKMYLGYFSTPLEASAAYLLAVKERNTA